MKTTLFALIAEDDDGLHPASTRLVDTFDQALDDTAEGNREREAAGIKGRWVPFALTPIKEAA